MTVLDYVCNQFGIAHGGSFLAGALFGTLSAVLFYLLSILFSCINLRR